MINYLGYIGVAGNFYGVYLMGRKKRVAWLVWLVSSSLMLIAALIQKQGWPLFLAGGYTVLNVYGIYKWYFKGGREKK